MLTQNEIDAAKSVTVAELNVQNQQKVEWPRKLIVAKAYIDQLERSGAMRADKVSAIRQSIDKDASSRAELAKLRNYATSLEKGAAAAKDSADATRLKALSGILRQPRQ